MSQEESKYGSDPYHGFGTDVLHVGSEPNAQTGAVCPPISLATTFAQASPGVKTGLDDPNSFGNGWEYSRTGNPTRGAFERCMAAVEHGNHAVAYSSGMAATASIIHLLDSGDHVISMDDVYGGTQRYFRRVVTPSMGINFSFVDLTDASNLEPAITEKTKLVWLETPTNPTLKISDISALAEICKSHNIILVVDNTFMSPYFQNPLDLGASIVMHSCTKYINGHSDVVMGVVVTKSDEIIEKLRFIQNGVGAVPSPFDSYLCLRGLKTLHVRMRAAAQHALELATQLEADDRVERVIYPGLPSHPQYQIAQDQMHGAGAMITFYVNGGLDNARKFLENVKVFTLAESLGAVESLVESPAIMTHASVPAEQRVQLGISDNLIRLSVGLESIVDLKADLDQALAASQA